MHEGALVILETHAGRGVLYRRLYQDARGMALEKDKLKCAALVRQRPHWPVYQCDSETAIKGGIGMDMPFSFIDIDPYRDPWPTVRALLESDRKRPRCFTIAVNDGLRQKVRMNGAWSTRSLQVAVEQFGADLHDVYLEVCRWMLQQIAEAAGCRLKEFRGFYGGHAKQMTHYYAVFTC